MYSFPNDADKVKSDIENLAFPGDTAKSNLISGPKRQLSIEEMKSTVRTKKMVEYNFDYKRLLNFRHWQICRRDKSVHVREAGWEKSEILVSRDGIRWGCLAAGPLHETSE